MTKDKTVTMPRELELFESILALKPEAYLHEPVYQVTESEVLEFARQLTAPVVERQAPFAWFTEDYLTDKSSTTYDELTSNRWKDKGWPVQPLFTSPPAPVAVQITLQQVLKAYDYAESHPHKYLRGTTNWCAAVAHELNACLDKVKELNQ